MDRRQFLASSGAFTAGAFMRYPLENQENPTPSKRKRVALVGTGIRGIGFWGRTVLERYGDLVEFVGLCDINPGRLEFGRARIGADCPTFLDFNEMMEKTQPDLLIVTTVDSTHHFFIIRGLEAGADVLTEKPMTTDEDKCRAILEAEERTGRRVIVGFNYRYNPHYTKLRELIAENAVGKLTSADFHWYLNMHHGASYFRRWHGELAMGGSLWVHKATHHFDLVNWWLNSDPVAVTAFGELEHYGQARSEISGPKCRTCPHKGECRFYWEIDDYSRQLYADHEHHDGYVRDNCVFRPEIDIWDKMSAQIHYANGVLVNYSLTTYSPYEGMRIAFNGYDGRIDSWDGIPWARERQLSQDELHAMEMDQGEAAGELDYEEIKVMRLFEDYQTIRVARERGGHGGGDVRLQDRIFKAPEAPDPLLHAAGSRDGAMSILVGIAARKSIQLGRTVEIGELTDIEPHPTRGRG